MSTPTVVLWTRVPIELATAVTEAATRAGKPSVSEWLRDLAAQACGKTAPAKAKAPKRTKRAKGGAK